MPVALIAHDNLYWYGGAERIAAEIASAYPEAPFWTILGRESVARRMGVADRLHTLLPENRATLANYKRLAPLYPALLRARKLPSADVLITSSFAFAHHFRTENDAPQVCYCYSPLRAAWSMTDDYAGARGFTKRLFEGALAGARRIDRAAAQRVAHYVAESRYVADQIERFYGLEAAVVYPPVDTSRFSPSRDGKTGDYFLFCGRLVEEYKRPSLAVEAFKRLPDHRLVIAGDGPALPELRRMASPNVEFTGHLSDDELIPLMQGCLATVFPSRDDFGLIPIETNACGRPCIAFAAGGALETVVPGVTGELFSRQDPDALVAAIEEFDPSKYEIDALTAHADSFAVERFADELKAEVATTLAAA